MRLLSYASLGILSVMLLANSIQTERTCTECGMPCYSEAILTRWMGMGDQFVHDYCIADYETANQPPPGYYSISYSTGQRVFRAVRENE